VLQLRPGEPRGAFEVPMLVPALGILVNVALICSRMIALWRDPGVGARPLVIAAVLGIVITILFVAMRPQAIPEDETDLPQPRA
jgi:hypothetical protein